MFIHRCKQRSDQWFELRLGKVTGTRCQEMVTGRATTFETLCRKIAAERLLGISSEKPFQPTPAMENGILLEDEARMVYEIETGSFVEEVGFVEKDKFIGISPDGLVGDNGLLEVKCPLVSTHIGYLLANGEAWQAYRWQLQCQLWASGRAWVDFCSYCPSFPGDKRLLIERVFPIKEDQKKISEKADQLKKRVREILKAIDELPLK